MSFPDIPSLISSLFGFSQDVLVWTNVPTAKYMKCEVSEPLKPMEHPVENGAVITDHFVIQPLKLTLVLGIRGNYQSIYSKIKDMRKAGDLQTIQTRTAIHDNLLITNLDRQETGEEFGIIFLKVDFQEVILIEVVTTDAEVSKEANTKSPAKKSDTNTKKAGKVNGTNASSSSTSKTSTTRSQSQLSKLKEWSTET